MSFAAPLLLLLTSELIGAHFVASSDSSKARAVSALTSIEGFWQDQDHADYFLGLEGPQLFIAYRGRVREAARVLRIDEENAWLCRVGREVKTTLQLVHGELVFRDPIRSETHRFRRLREKPTELSLSELHLDKLAPIAEQSMLQIQKELYRRHLQEQAMLGPKTRRPSASGKFPWFLPQESTEPEASRAEAELLVAARTTENDDYLHGLLSEVGWIDVERFGYGTSNAAFFLVQHTWDPTLLRAVLPLLKQDVDAGRMESSAYALMYDRLQLVLGFPQRYGSQVARDETGGVYVLPVEDSSRIAELRKQLGLIPLSEYLGVFGATETKISTACGSR